MLKGDAGTICGSLVNSVHVSFPNGSVKLNFYSSFEISGWRVSIFLYKFVDMSDGQGYIVHPSVAPGV